MTKKPTPQAADPLLPGTGAAASGTKPAPVRAEAVEVWLFDLDNTLYPASCNLFQQVDRRMGEFVSDFLALELDEARALQKRYFRDHGSTMRGLMENHGLDPAAFLAYVHDIDVTPVDPSPALDAALAALPGRKIVFTNGSTRHAENIMDRLGVRHRFDEVFDIVAAGYLPKPRPQTYETLVARHAIAPRRAVFFDDIARNLGPAAALGMTTVWVANDTDWAHEGFDQGAVHHVTRDLIAWLQDASGADDDGAPVPRR